MDERNMNKNGKMQDGMNHDHDMHDHDMHGHDHSNCHGGMCWGGHRFSILRFVLLLLLVCFIFSMGVRFGELKGQIEGGYGYGYSHSGMMDNGWSGEQYSGGRGYMMPYGQNMNANMNSNMMPMQQTMPMHSMATTSVVQ